ncbi:MAG: (d)CMP kinase [Acidobacteriota bacterium]
MRSRGPIICIDGPAGSGKSTAARNLARRLGYVFLDTGATFRAVALKALRQQGDLEDPTAMAELARAAQIGFRGKQGEKVFLDGEDVTTAIRSQEVSAGASRIAVHPGVREVLMDLWRRIAEEGGVVLEGRDIGTVVFQDAELKFFLVARPAVRAARRYRDRAAERGLTLDQVKQDLARRDEADRRRAHAPLLRAPDAIEVDTSDLTPDETLDRLEREVRGHLDHRESRAGCPDADPRRRF